MNEYRIKAYAKINLGLDVVRRLENGYHEVKMVMQTVGIYDVLDFERTDGGIVITTDCGELPTDSHSSGHGRRQYGCSSYLKRNEPSV